MSIDVNVQNDLVIVTESSEDITVNVSNAAGPAGVGVPVGGSTGQVLKKVSATNYDTYWAAEGGGVPYSGASGNVNLGEFGLSAGQLTLDTTPTGTASVGTTRWNDTIGSSETTLKGGSVILKNGVDLVARVVNKVSPNTTLTKANYQAVKISGAQGQRLAVALAQANTDANSADTIGLVTETIATNQEGFIMTVGNLEGINTTGSLQGETWADGDVLYLSPTTAGRLTNIKPTGATGHIVVIGYVEYSHVNNGKIYVKIMNGWELDELHNVYITSPTNDQVLTYESSTSLWKNKTPTGGGGTPAGSNTQIQYNNSGAFGASANFIWDNANTKLNIGTNAGSIINATNVNVVGSGSLAGVTIKNTTTTDAQTGFFLLNSSNDYCQLFKASRTYTTYKTIASGDFGLYNGESGDIVLLNDFGTGKIKFASGGSSTAQMTLTSAGRLLLGTTSEGTYILDAVGGGRFTGGIEELSGEQIGLRLEASATTKNIYLSLKNTNASGNDYTLRSLTSGRFEIVKYTPALATAMFAADTTFTQLTANATPFLFGRESNLVPGLWIGVAQGSQTLYNGTLLRNGTDTILSSSSNIYFLGSSNYVGRIFSTTGNWLIQTGGTFTDNGYKLDVNGTSRFSDILYIGSGSAIRGLGNFYIDGPGLGGTITYRANTHNFPSGNLTGMLDIQTGGITVNGGSNTVAKVTGSSGVSSLRIENTKSGGGTWYFENNRNAVDGSLEISNNIGVAGLTLFPSRSISLGTYTETASAIFAIDSTTKGFLPPRMTTTQKNAIATPAAGLVVYDTDTNKLCCYNGTTWNDLF